MTDLTGKRQDFLKSQILCLIFDFFAQSKKWTEPYSYTEDI